MKTPDFYGGIPKRIGIYTKDELDLLVRNTIPKDRTIAVVVATDLDGLEVTVEMKKETKFGTWDIAGVYKREWRGDNKIGAKVVWSM